MKVLYDNSKQIIPIKMWLNDIEEGAVKQAQNLSNLPFAYKHIAIMPDAHQGYGMPIGGVLATKGVVIPNAVGCDVGCGMCAVKTSLTDISQEQIKKIFGGSKDYQGGIRSYVPVGFHHQSKKQDESLMPNIDAFSRSMSDGNDNYDPNNFFSICEVEYQSALKQIGTLGGGNHFIEIQKGSDGHIWIMLHSGSRNLGYKVAKYYNDLAKELNKKWHTAVPKEFDLAFLPLDSEEGKNYLREMQYCVDFALANRKLMMDKIIGIFKELFLNITFESMINIAHNYVRMENHFGTNIMIHRKGATSAKEGEIGIIPGSQGTKSYIVQGLGNPESFMSCSHGAGRKMSRTKACNELDLNQEIKQLDDQGIIHGIRTKKDLDEATGSYKDIDEVMKNQKSLVKIVIELTPLGVIKG